MSTERYCQSPAASDNKGVFSYQELMLATPPQRDMSKRKRKDEELAEGTGQALLEIVKLNTAC